MHVPEETESQSLLPEDTDLLQVEPLTAAYETKKSIAKTSSRSINSSKQDVAIVREVAAVKAHIAAFGETRRRFECTISKLNSNPLFASASVAWKQVQDRYKRLHEF